MRLFRQINEWVALRTVSAMSTIWCVYLFLLWSLLPSFSKGLEPLVFYVSGGVIQLVALPLIMLGQKLEGRAAERRAIHDHRILLELQREIQELKTTKRAKKA
jgi:hypothetical protein